MFLLPVILIYGVLMKVFFFFFFLKVHRAILHNGERVVVKVQRPGLKKLFEIDLSEYAS